LFVQESGELRNSVRELGVDQNVEIIRNSRSKRSGDAQAVGSIDEEGSEAYEYILSANLDDPQFILREYFSPGKQPIGTLENGGTSATRPKLIPVFIEIEKIRE